MKCDLILQTGVEAGEEFLFEEHLRFRLILELTSGNGVFRDVLQLKGPQFCEIHPCI